MRSTLSTLGLILMIPLLVFGATGAANDKFASGLRMFNQGNYEGAVKQLQAAVAEKPDDAARRVTFGVALANLRRYDDAIVQFKEAAKLDPEDPTPDFLLQGSYQGIGMVAQSERSRMTAEKKLGQSVVVAQNDAINLPQLSAKSKLQPEPCSKLMDRAVTQYPENAIAHNLFGDVCQVKGRFEEAIAHYRRATELAPAWVKPWFNLGMANLATDPQQAATNFRKVLELDPKNAQAQMWLGDAYTANRDYKEAIDAYSKAADSKALEPQARSRLGNVYLKQRNLTQAETEFNAAVQAGPQNAAANAGLGDVLRAQNKLDESRKQYERAAGLAQSAPTQQTILNNNVAQVYIDKGDCRKALEELKKVVASDGRTQTVQMLLDAYQRCGLLDEGISEYEAALKARPNNFTAMRFLEMAYAKTGNFRGRMEMSRRLLKSVPAETPIWARELGLALSQMGDKSGAIDAWKRGLEFYPAKDVANIIAAAKSAGLLTELRAWYESESETRKSSAPSLVLALICERTGDYTRAVEARTRLTKLYPNNQQYWIWLGDAQKLAGKIPAAQASYERAASMSNDVTLRALAQDRLNDLGK